MELAARLRDGLAEIKGVSLYGRPFTDRHVPLFICNINGMRPVDAGAVLDGDFEIAVRTGLHCAPLVHEDLKTGGRGAVRFSLGYANTGDDIEQALEAVRLIAGMQSK